MATNNKANQAAYKERMYNAGYKQVQVWVPRELETKTIKLERRMFLKRLESLTVGLSKAKLSKIFKEVLVIIKEKLSQEET